jgi:D-alanyl-D-alanine-carboxypeptidase/D-alanyl-D-alanine-endopeptidase
VGLHRCCYQSGSPAKARNPLLEETVNFKSAVLYYSFGVPGLIVGAVQLTDPLDEHLDWNIPVPDQDGRPIRPVDLVTHTSGLPREVERPPSPPEDPMRTLTKEEFIANLKQDRLLFTPGGGDCTRTSLSTFSRRPSAAAKLPYHAADGRPAPQRFLEISSDATGCTHVCKAPAAPSRDRRRV